MQNLPFDVIKLIFDNNDKGIDKRNFVISSNDTMTKPLFHNFKNTFSDEYNKIKHDEKLKFIFEMCYDGNQDNITEKYLIKNDTNIINIMIQFKLLNFLELLIDETYVTNQNNITYAINCFDKVIITKILKNGGHHYLHENVDVTFTNNNLQFCEWYCNKYGPRDKYLHKILVNGNLDMLQIFYEKCKYLEFNDAEYNTAIFFNHLHIVKWFDDKKFICDKNPAIKTVTFVNDKNMIEYFNNKGYNIEHKQNYDSYYYDELKKVMNDELKKVMNHGTFSYDYFYNYENILCELFAMKNNFKMVNWLLDNDYKYDQSVFNLFMIHNNIEAMQYFIDEKLPILSNVMYVAANRCNLETIKCLHNNGYKIDETMAIILINNGKIDVIDWIIDNCEYYDMLGLFDKFNKKL